MIGNTSSIFTSLRHIRALLNRSEKLTCLKVILFALLVSVFEILTANILILFAQLLYKPDVIFKYTSYLGLNLSITPLRALAYTALLVGISYVLKSTLAILELYYQNTSVQRIASNFKRRYIERYSQMEYVKHLRHSPAYGLSIVESDIYATFSALSALGIFISESAIFIAMISLIITINPQLSIYLAILGGGLSLLLVRFVFPIFYNYGKAHQEYALRSYEGTLQFFNGYKEILLSGNKASFIEIFAQRARAKAHVQALQNTFNMMPRIVIEILFISIFVFTVAYLCFQQEAPGDLLGILSAYFYAAFRLMPGLNRMITQVNSFKGLSASIERTRREYEAAESPAYYLDCKDFTFKTEIQINGISFAYPETKTKALHDFTLTIKKGERVGLIGETGSGKSTLVDVILGLLKPQKGSITSDAKHPLNCWQWQAQIGYVPQSIYLTHGTIKANVAFGEESVDINRLNKALETAQLNKLIAKLPNGIDSEVGERGVRLSGGERQRIAIARALYHDAKVLIFDEATSALDDETEERLMKTIQDVSKGRTVIMIAHRLTTLRFCDRIIELEGGSIKKTLSYNALMNRQKKAPTS